MAETIPPLSVTQEKTVRIVEFTNSKILDEQNIKEIGDTLNVLIDESEYPKILVDFASVDHLSSAALGMLINVNNRVKQRNGQLRLTNIKPQIFEVFVITKLNKLFRIYPTRTEAMASFTEGMKLAADAGRIQHAQRVSEQLLEWAVAQGSRRPRRAGGQARGTTLAKPLKFEIRSLPLEGRDVQKRIMDEVERCGFDDHSVFAIKLSLEEALINAIKHGNGDDPAKKVHIEAKVTPKKFEVVIEDEGKGFERSCVPDPTAEENLCKCSGRGILLMERFMNRVQWTHGGRRIKMVKNNEAK